MHFLSFTNVFRILQLITGFAICPKCDEGNQNTFLLSFFQKEIIPLRERRTVLLLYFQQNSAKKLATKYHDVLNVQCCDCYYLDVFMKNHQA